MRYNPTSARITMVYGKKIDLIYFPNFALNFS